MKLQYSVPVSNKSLTFQLPKGQYGTIFIEYDVDAAAAVTLTRADFGNVILNWNGQDVINVDAEILNLLNNVYGGVSEFSAVDGGATRMSVFITTGLWFDSRNVYDIGDNDNVYLKLDFSSLGDSAKTDSGNINIYTKTKSGVMRYLHNITSRPVVSSGAATLADTTKLNNVSQIYLKNPATLCSNIQFSKDGQSIIDASPETLIAYSDFIHNLETTNTTLAIDFVESGDIRESVGVDISYKLTFTGAGTQYIYYSSVDFTPGKAVESERVVEAKLLPLTNSLKSAGISKTVNSAGQTIFKKNIPAD